MEYIITGDFEELSNIMIPVLKESRFLSDKPNVKGFTWYPITTQVQAVELKLTATLSDDELCMLCREYTSLTIARLLEDGSVDRLITNEGIETA